MHSVGFPRVLHLLWSSRQRPAVPKWLKSMSADLAQGSLWRTRMSTPSITDIVHHIEQGGVVALRGVQELELARTLLKHAVRGAGYSLVFDPESTGDLADYLTVSGMSALEGAITGASVGAVVDLLVDGQSSAAAFGLVLGLLAGIARGVDRVERGWRVRAVRDADGAPCVTIRLLEPASR
jgi:hypothetical protein